MSAIITNSTGTYALAGPSGYAISTQGVVISPDSLLCASFLSEPDISPFLTPDGMTCASFLSEPDLSGGIIPDNLLCATFLSHVSASVLAAGARFSSRKARIDFSIRKASVTFGSRRARIVFTARGAGD